jgi:hypothetical protein
LFRFLRSRNVARRGSGVGEGDTSSSLIGLGSTRPDRRVDRLSTKEMSNDQMDDVEK